MGLDTSHNCWHGAYSSFKAFRDAVAVAAKERYDYVPNYEAHPASAFYGWWDDDHPYGHILDVFFIHSDCEGWIFPQHAEPLASHLERLLGSVDDDWRERLDLFCQGLRKAADEWEPVAFR